MASLETTIRLIVIGQEILIAVLFLVGSGKADARISGAMLVLGVAGYLYISDPVLGSTVPPLRPVAMLLALAVPYSLWSFARAVFEHAWPPVWMTSAVLLTVTVVWAIFAFAESAGSGWLQAGNVIIHVVSLVIVLHALWFTAYGRLDDLLESRRAFRVIFVTVVAAQVAIVLVVELALGNTPPPAWLTFANVIIIAALTLGLAIPMFQLNAVFFESGDHGRSAQASGARLPVRAAEEVLRTKLLALMDSGYYRESGLTIRTLAEKIGYPEHQLRSLINGSLGYRNFSAFLHSFRLGEAKVRLADPDQARTPVLTIALELGYGSIGPFNRAFKDSTGVTPTEFRRQQLAGNRADFE